MHIFYGIICFEGISVLDWRAARERTIVSPKDLQWPKNSISLL